MRYACNELQRKSGLCGMPRSGEESEEETATKAKT